MKTVNIIGDCAGRLDELMELLAKMPAADLVLSVGDLVDRGPKSREVIEWFMADPLGRDAVHGNHENMMLEACLDLPSHDIWEWNGGRATRASYNFMPVPEEHLRWLANRPLWFMQEGLFVSHAPVQDVEKIPAQFDDWRKYRIDDDDCFIWNRYLDNRPMPNHFMVYGHNSRIRQHTFYSEATGMIEYARCIDNSSCKQLVGMHWPSREMFSVEYHQ